MLSENIKTRRKAKGLSQEELALRLHVVRQTISKWEQGLSVPDADLLLALSQALDTPVSDLLGEPFPSRRPRTCKSSASGWRPSTCSWPGERPPEGKGRTWPFSLCVSFFCWGSSSWRPWAATRPSAGTTATQRPPWRGPSSTGRSGCMPGPSPSSSPPPPWARSSPGGRAESVAGRLAPQARKIPLHFVRRDFKGSACPRGAIKSLR